jgi:hypothetical protein
MNDARETLEGIIANSLEFLSSEDAGALSENTLVAGFHLTPATDPLADKIRELLRSAPMSVKSLLDFVERFEGVYESVAFSLGSVMDFTPTTVQSVEELHAGMVLLDANGFICEVFVGVGRMMIARTLGDTTYADIDASLFPATVLYTRT